MADEIGAQIGEVRGRLGALESRVDRYETDMRQTLNAMDVKLDRIVSRIDRADGALAIGERATDWIKYVVSGAIGAAGTWIAAHFGK